jgi:receptor expression-enhancing protein 5/6
MSLLDKISEITGQPKQRVLKLALIFLVLFVVFGVGSSIITNVIGVAYPVFMSFRALESADDLADDKQWLTYWVVFGLFNVTDSFAGFILHFIPFYYVLKVATLIWLFHPKFLGATYVYNELIQPYVGHINEIESEIDKAGAKIINDTRNTFGLKKVD